MPRPSGTSDEAKRPIAQKNRAQENGSQENAAQESDAGKPDIAEKITGLPPAIRKALNLLQTELRPGSDTEPDPSAASRRAQPAAQCGPKRTSPASLARHKRKCTICHHPDRETIEQDFLRWCSPEDIAREFDVESSAIYRHVHATGLNSQRRANLRLALEPLIEQTYHVGSKADSIVRAIRTYAHINDQSEWVDPVKKLVIARENPAASHEHPETAPENSNRKSQLLEADVNGTE